MLEKTQSALNSVLNHSNQINPKIFLQITTFKILTIKKIKLKKHQLTVERILLQDKKNQSQTVLLKFLF